MSGPMPKDPALRQRRNRSASRALLSPETRPIEHKPRLPANLDENGWHGLTRRWWADVWSSPLAAEYLRADLGALFRLAILVDRFFKTYSLAVAKEIRMLEREFGLTPLARRRLEWTVAQAEEAKDIHEHKRSQRAVIVERDPRELLDS